jgi:WhiB family redox-sensing transcriptional regulator
MNNDPTRPPIWHLYAACRHTDPTQYAKIFFPQHGHTANKAKKICATCPARKACLEHAVNKPELHGIWAGTTPRDRVQIRKQQQQNDAA